MASKGGEDITMPHKHTFSAYWSDKLGETITECAKAQCPDGYPITMIPHGLQWDSLTRAINEGIDSHLEAVMFEQIEEPHRISAFNKIKITVTPDTLHALVRRLMEYNDGTNEDGGMSNESQQLAACICDTLEIGLV
jgi:hypothetical protein